MVTTLSLNFNFFCTQRIKNNCFCIKTKNIFQNATYNQHFLLKTTNLHSKVIYFLKKTPIVTHLSPNSDVLLGGYLSQKCGVL